MKLYSSARRAAWPLLALALGSLPVVADSEEHGSFLRMDSTAVVPGSPANLYLRSPLANAPVLLVFGDSALGLPLGGALPVLRVGPPFSFVTAVSTGPLGINVLPFQFPANVPASVSLYGQGFLVTSGGDVKDSNLLALSPASGPATWIDATGNLPASAVDQVGVDTDFADLDKDGDLDLVTVGGGEAPLPLVFINDGTGVFTDETQVRIPVEARIGARTVEIADANGDGWDDIFLGGAYDEVQPAPNLLLTNTGDGFFSVASFPAGTGRPLDAEFADVDGDEDLDLVVINLEEVEHDSEVVAGAQVYLNVDGAFTLSQSFSELPSGDPHNGGGGVSLGDFDLDGDLDLFLARSEAQLGWQNELWLNDGTGFFFDSTTASLPAVEDNSHEVSVLDANGDGRLDVFVFNSIASVPEANHLLLNQGGSPPAFVSANANLPANLGNSTNIRFSGDVADVDQDGDIDVLVGIHALPSGGEAVLLLNQGGKQGGMEGQFAIDPGFAFGPAVIDGDPAFEDVDGDGDVDLYLGSAGDIFEILPPQDHLYLNQL